VRSFALFALGRYFAAKVNKLNSAKKAETIVARALDGAIVERDRGDQGWDIRVLPRGASAPIALEVKWVGEGWPGDVRRLVSQLPEPWPENLVLVARQFSSGALEWLSARDANWVDETGRARIVGPGSLVVIRDLDRQLDRAPRQFRWSPSARSLGELLLAHPRPRIQVSDLARESGWSPAQVTTVLAGFDRAGWTRKVGAQRGPGAWRILADPDGFLSAWSAAIEEEPRKRRLGHRATRDAMALLSEALAPALDKATQWALSGWAGAEASAPFMTAVPTLHIYVAVDQFAGPLSEAMETAGVREVEEGARVVFWAADQRVLALAEQDGGLPVVSRPRLYADLSALGGRGHDAAEHLKSELIDPLHERVRREAEGSVAKAP
jgi:hypothetical protein